MAEQPKRIDGIHQALIEAQRAMGTSVTKDARANTGRFAYAYATLGTLLETVTPHLHAAGLVLYQSVDVTERGETVLITTVAHAETDQTVVSRYPVRCAEPNDPQKVGGAVTYARRYSLLALLGLAAEDDDGANARQPAPARPGAPRAAEDPSKIKPAPRTNAAGVVGPVPGRPEQAEQPPTSGLEQAAAGFRERLAAARAQPELARIAFEIAAAKLPDGPEKTGLLDLYQSRMRAFGAAS